MDTIYKIILASAFLIIGLTYVSISNPVYYKNIINEQQISNNVSVRYIEYQINNSKPEITKQREVPEIIKRIENTGSYYKSTDGGLTWSSYIHSNNNFNLSVLPNPAQTNIEIRIDGKNSETYQIDIFDIIGNNVLPSEKINTYKHSLNINELSKGMYILKVMDMNGNIKTVNFFKY